MKPEELATLKERTVGLYNIIPIWKRHYEKHMTLFEFGMVLRKNGIKPCECGAYTDNGKCTICERSEA